MNEIEAKEAWDHLVETNSLKQGAARCDASHVVRFDTTLGQPIWQVQKKEIKPSLFTQSVDVHLPLSFQYSFLFEGLRRLLQQEHLVVGCTEWR